MPQPRVLVFQHMEMCHPGIFRSFLCEDGIAWRAPRLDLGEQIPDLAAFDALWVMGGPRISGKRQSTPGWPVKRAAIRDAVRARHAVLGICLGHQLLADALCGRCLQWPRAEVRRPPKEALCINS